MSIKWLYNEKVTDPSSLSAECQDHAGGHREQEAPNTEAMSALCGCSHHASSCRQKGA